VEDHQDGAARLPAAWCENAGNFCLGKWEDAAVMAIKTSYNWFFLWDYTFYKWGFVSTYN